jgi:hypothetical protein
MLQNAPDNPNACSIDIFDGFGNAGMAQPPMFQTEEYDNKFAIPRIEEMSNDSGSPTGVPKNEMNSPFVSSPAMMSPGGDMQHGMPNEFNSLPDMVMSPMGGSTGSLHAGSFNGQPNGQQSHQHQSQPQHQPQFQPQHQQHGQQHQQHHSISGFQNLNPQLNLHQPPNMNVTSQGLAPNMGIGQGISSMGNGINHSVNHVMNSGLASPLGPHMNGKNMMARPPPQRAHSFAMTTPQIRTIGDFHALQRANSDMNTMSPLGITNMGSEMDFNTLSR